jgi:hypothetical protein
MRARDISTPETPKVDSDEDYNSALRTVLLPVLGGLALAAISLVILYAIFKHFKQKRKAKKTELSAAIPDTGCTQSSTSASTRIARSPISCTSPEDYNTTPR